MPTWPLDFIYVHALFSVPTTRAIAFLVGESVTGSATIWWAYVGRGVEGRIVSWMAAPLLPCCVCNMWARRVADILPFSHAEQSWQAVRKQ